MNKFYKIFFYFTFNVVSFFAILFFGQLKYYSKTIPYEFKIKL